MAGKFRKIQAMFWPVTVKFAKGKNKFDKEVIDIKYVRLTKDESKDLLGRYRVEEEATAAESSETYSALNDEIIETYIVDWKLDQEDGTPFDFNPENLEMVMNHPDFGTAILKGFWDFQNGGATKN